jgi:hypothetical protein
MSEKRSRSWLLLAVLVGSVMMAGETGAQTLKDEFQQGMEAAAAGHYEQALRHFLRARQGGATRPALDYNLGVTYFKLGRYEQARKAFMRLADAPGFEQLAYFNLGLVANQAKDERAAVAWFQRAYAAGSDKNIKALSRQALRRLAAEPRKTLAETRPWTGFVSTLLSHDSNVTLVNDDLTGATSESDNAFEVLAAAEHWLHGGYRDGLQLSFSADAQMYAQNGQYDFSLVHAGAWRFGQLGPWQTRFGLSWDEIYFDGRKYQRLFNADVRGRYPLAAATQLRVRYRLSSIRATNKQYDYLDGWRQQLRAGLWLRRGERRYKAYYQLEVNNRNDYTDSANNFTSYSPTRHSLQLTATLPLAAAWSARLDARIRYSVYSDANDLVGGASKVREDMQYRLGGYVTYIFARDWELEAGYSYTDNNSNIDQSLAQNYSYRRSLLTAGVNWFF